MKKPEKDIFGTEIQDPNDDAVIMSNNMWEEWEAYHKWEIKENYIKKPSVEKMIKFVLVWWGRNKCKQEASFGCNGERCEQMVYLREPNFVKLAKTIIKEIKGDEV